MATVIDRPVQALADVAAVIVDRTVIPEKVIGQAWVISKSRLVVLASTVAAYAETPWALLVKFPYPDLTYAVKAISLHPEFNKRAARDFYLSQTNELLPQSPIFENDIATITTEAEIPDLQPDKVQELNRALSLPLHISAQDLNGAMKAGETGNILQRALTSNRNGVLTFFDERKVPFARVLIKQGRLVRAVYENLQNEFAVCELMWRKPGGNFVLITGDNVSWAQVPEITMATDQLAAEAVRRTQDLPRMLDALGGPNARYSKSRAQIDLSSINPQIRWVVERLWPNLDGFLPLTKLSDRLQVDTFTAIQALWEMKHLGLVVTATAEQFHRSGQLGSPLTPGHDIDLKFWDPLQAFYLDDLSMQPVMLQGNYFGSAHLLQVHTLLHTMQVPAKYGAVILKEGRLVGLYNGKFNAPLQNPPPFPLGQMAWIGSLSDMSAKRMRTQVQELEEGSEDLPIVTSGRGTMTGIKSRSSMQALQASSGSTEKLPSETPPPPVSNEPEFLQKITKIQALGLGAGMFVLGFLMFVGSMMSPKPAPTALSTQPAANTKTASATSSSSQQVPVQAESMKGALKIAGFKDTTIPPFVFVDTSSETAPKPSFGMEAEQANQKVLFCVWPNPAVNSAVDSNMTQPPFTPLRKSEFGKVFDKGSTSHNFYWKVCRYWNKDNKDTTAFVGAFPSRQADKSILVIATPLKGEGELDYKNTISVIERMFDDRLSQENSEQGSASAELASEEDIQKFREAAGAQIKQTYKAPLDSDRANKCVVRFVIDAEGNVSKIELKYSSGMEDVDKALQKAIISKAPYLGVPKTKSGDLPMQVTLDAGEWFFSEP